MPSSTCVFIVFDLYVPMCIDEVSVGDGQSRVRGGQALPRQETFRAPVRDQARRVHGHQQVCRVVVRAESQSVLAHKSKHRSAYRTVRGSPAVATAVGRLAGENNKIYYYTVENASVICVYVTRV